MAILCRAAKNSLRGTVTHFTGFSINGVPATLFSFVKKHRTVFSLENYKINLNILHLNDAVVQCTIVFFSASNPRPASESVAINAIQNIQIQGITDMYCTIKQLLTATAIWHLP